MFKFINKIRNKEYSKEKGFSLLELSVAVGIAAIVGAAGIVATTGFIGSAETKKDNYVANAERAIAEAESSSLALGETGSTGGTNSSGEEGAGSEAQEKETPVAPGVPTTVLASGITSTGATLAWGEPETGEVEEYIVTLNGDVQGSEPIPNDVFSYVFTELTVNTYYEAKVFAKSPAGTLSQAATEKFYTAFRPMVATGGDKVYDILRDGTVYRVHEFTTVGESSFVVTDAGETGEVEYLVVAGGGGSEGNANQTAFGYRPAPGGGAGAGGYRSSVVGENTGGGLPAEDAMSVSPGSFSVTVGSGGDVAEKGEDSSFGNIVSEGGAQSGNNSSFNGGSGSGSGHSGPGGGLGTPGQGFNGGDDTYASPNYPSGGGGGAGGVGGDGACGGCAAGNGGPGVTSNITGTSVTRGGGGGGGTWSNNARGSGGAGGGGAALTDGAPNTGGGAGAGGRSGGSGIIIVRYPIQFTSVQ